MTITTAQQHELYKLAVGLYRAAPGTLYLSPLAASLASGASIEQLYDILANLPSFQGQAPAYDDAAPDAQFVSQFVENLVGDSALLADKDAIAAYLATLLPATTRGALMKLAIDLLDAVDESDAAWGAAAARLHNRIEVARFYTEELQGWATDFAALRGTIAGVTSDDATVTAANQANAVAANPGTSSAVTADPPAEPSLPDPAAQPAPAATPVAGSEPAEVVQPDDAGPAAVTPDAGDEPAPAATEAVASVVPHDDTVTVADHSVMSLNSRADAEAADLTIDSYLNYDHISADDVTDRLSIAELRAGEEALGGADAPQACNIAQFNFSLGGGSDTVSYHNETARIAAVVGFNANDDTQFVMIDGNDSGGYDDSIADRVDRLVEVENIVASQGESILDVTNSTMDLAITFSREITEEDGFDVHRVQLSNLDTDAVFGMNFLEHRDTELDDDGDGIDGNDDEDIFAVWTTVEGSDFNEKVELTDAETAFMHNFHLRGGDNEVNYNELTRSIVTTIDMTDWDADDPLGTGLIMVNVDFTDGNFMDIGANDFISSYTAGNGIAAGSLRIEASQDAEDAIAFALGLDSPKIFLLGEVADGSDQITVRLGSEDQPNTMILTGFEELRDSGDSDDVYTMEDLTRTLNNLALRDDDADLDPTTPSDDSDTIAVMDDAVGFDDPPETTAAGDPDEISLERLNDIFGFDFDVLDVTAVEEGNLILLGDDDDQDDDAVLDQADADYAGNSVQVRDTVDSVKVGDLDLIDDVSLFPAIIFTDASIDSSGDEFNIDIGAGEFQDGSGDALFTFDPTLLIFDFSQVSPDTDLTITVNDPGMVGVTIITDGQDTVTGGAGNDTLTGGPGADTLDGGIGTEMRTVELSGSLDATAEAAAVTIALGFGAVTFTINEIVGVPVDTDPVLGGDLDIQAGAGADVVGAALALLVNANLDLINVADNFNTDDGIAANTTTTNADVELMGAVYNNSTNQLTFIFASGANVDVDDLILVTSGDGGTLFFAASADTTIEEGGDGGSDRFVYNDASESTLTSMDQLPGFTIDGATGNNDAIDVIFLGLGIGTFVEQTEAPVADFAAAQAFADLAFSGNFDAAAASDGTNAWVFVDANQDLEFGDGDMVFGLVGVTDVSGFQNNNVLFF